MGKRVRLCGKAQVAPGGMPALDRAGLSALAVFDADGSFHCTSDPCTHDAAASIDGFLGAAPQFSCEKPLKTDPATTVGEDLHADVE